MKALWVVFWTIAAFALAVDVIILVRHDNRS